MTLPYFVLYLRSICEPSAILLDISWSFPIHYRDFRNFRYFITFFGLIMTQIVILIIRNSVLPLSKEFPTFPNTSWSFYFIQFAGLSFSQFFAIFDHLEFHLWHSVRFLLYFYSNWFRNRSDFTPILFIVLLYIYLWLSIKKKEATLPLAANLHYTSDCVSLCSPALYLHTATLSDIYYCVHIVLECILPFWLILVAVFAF